MLRPCHECLNAPFGARCFLAPEGQHPQSFRYHPVLMHLLALGAFWRKQMSEHKTLYGESLNAPFGARCFLASPPANYVIPMYCLNAPFGARCFLAYHSPYYNQIDLGLNAPFGARCFLTERTLRSTAITSGCLNAPFGARCLLTRVRKIRIRVCKPVLMRLLALGAF